MSWCHDKDATCLRTWSTQRAQVEMEQERGNQTQTMAIPSDLPDTTLQGPRQ
jgi:hypothetical protein